MGAKLVQYFIVKHL